MAKDLKLEHHRATPSDVAEILKKPISQEMLGGHVMLEDPVVGQGNVALHLRYPLRRRPPRPSPARSSTEPSPLDALPPRPTLSTRP